MSGCLVNSHDHHRAVCICIMGTIIMRACFIAAGRREMGKENLLNTRKCASAQIGKKDHFRKPKWISSVPYPFYGGLQDVKWPQVDFGVMNVNELHFFKKKIKRENGELRRVVDMRSRLKE